MLFLTLRMVISNGARYVDTCEVMNDAVLEEIARNFGMHHSNESNDHPKL